MKAVIAIFADFEQTFWGTRSRLRESLAGAPLIQHTLRRAAQIDYAAPRVLVVQPRDAPLAQASIDEAGLRERIRMLPIDDGRRARPGLLRAARKWNLDSWRGGPLCTTWFDEFIEPTLVARLLSQTQAQAALCLCAAQPLLDAPLAGAMLAHQERNHAEAALTFTQAPPGLAGIVLTDEQAAELVAHNVPVGILLGYRPELPRPDPITRVECLRIPSGVAQTRARFVADTQAACMRIADWLTRAGGQASAADLCADVARGGDGRALRLPVEIELELTTEDPLPESTLRPRGSRVPRRNLSDLAALERIAREYAQLDDRLLLLGGHGDPLLHPQFADACAQIKQSGVFGLAVSSTLVELSEAALEALLSGVDLLEVRLDATTRGAYERLHRRDAFEQVLANIERIQQARLQRACPQPIVIPSLTRCHATLDQLEAFYDHWIQITGAALLQTYNRYGGLMPTDPISPAHPPLRSGCRRLANRMMLLADGATTLCAEDVRGVHPIGDWRVSTLAALWNGPARQSLRALHAAHQFAALPQLCQACEEWFRP